MPPDVLCNLRSYCVERGIQVVVAPAGFPTPLISSDTIAFVLLFTIRVEA